MAENLASESSPIKVRFPSSFTDNLLDSESQEMCNTSEKIDGRTSSKGMKRKLSAYVESYKAQKRLSPSLNTPQEWKEEKRKILKISIQKLKGIDDAELFLRRAVLINNTVKRLQNELSKERARQRKFQRRIHGRERQHFEYDILSNNCLSKSFLFDDPFLGSDKITDDMTDILMDNLTNKLGINIQSVTSSRDKSNYNTSMCEPVPRDAMVNENSNLNKVEFSNKGKLTTKEFEMAVRAPCDLTEASDSFTNDTGTSELVGDAMEEGVSAAAVVFNAVVKDRDFSKENVLCDPFLNDGRDDLNQNVLTELHAVSDKEFCIGSCTHYSQFPDGRTVEKNKPDIKRQERGLIEINSGPECNCAFKNKVNNCNSLISGLFHCDEQPNMMLRLCETYRH